MSTHLIMTIGSVPIRSETANWAPENLIEHFRKTIQCVDIELVTVRGWGASHVSYQLRDGTTITTWGRQETFNLAEIVRRHANVIRAQATRYRDGLPHRIDRLDALVLIKHGGQDALRQFSRTAVPDLKIHVRTGFADSIVPDSRHVQLASGEATLEGNRVTSTIRCGDQQWSKGSFLIHRKMDLPKSVTMALAGRPLDQIVSGTWFEGMELTIRKAWNINGSLGMTFDKEMITLNEAMSLEPLKRLAA